MVNLTNIINDFASFNQVKAIAIGGSSTAKTADDLSDIDTYVFTEKEIPVKSREKLIQKYSTKYAVGEDYFGAGDEFLADKAGGREFDIMYWGVKWFQDTVTNVWEKFNASNGYSTCFLYTLNNLDIKYDPTGWLQDLKNKLKKPYPEELQKNIIERNMMLMKDKPFASYYEQIEKAVKRNDENSINHRIAAFMASYFDVIFAKNKLLHPGEKRLVKYAQEHCKILPENFQENISRLFNAPNAQKTDILNTMTEQLRKIL